MTNEKAISNPRSEIDRIDGEILRLLNERASIALRVGEAKTSVDTSLCDPGREREVLGRLCEQNSGPFDDQSIADIFQRIIDESLHLQQKAFAVSGSQASHGHGRPLVRENTSVAFLGEHGTFSEEAATAILAAGCKTHSFPTIDELFHATRLGKADYILTPLENTLVGTLHRSFTLLLESGLSIVGEVILPVSHFLVSGAGATLETIQTVESHPAALAQCEKFFTAHPHIQRVEADDTAGSVRRAVESGDATHAAIGSRRAAEIYGGNILLAHIEDRAENYTRFVLLSSEQEEDPAGEKITLVLRLVNRPGSLHSALRPFVRRGIDLTKIESMPIKEDPGQFYFYMELQAPGNEGEVPAALNEIRQEANEVRLIGRYRSVRLTKQEVPTKHTKSTK